MGSCKYAIMGLVPLAVSARVTMHFVTVFSKTCNKHICGSYDIDCYLTFFNSYLKDKDKEALYNRQY